MEVLDSLSHKAAAILSSCCWGVHESLLRGCLMPYGSSSHSWLYLRIVWRLINTDQSLLQTKLTRICGSRASVYIANPHVILGLRTMAEGNAIKYFPWSPPPLLRGTEWEGGMSRSLEAGPEKPASKKWLDFLSSK